MLFDLKNKNMEEIWRNVKGYEELYQVSNYGQIRSVDRFVGYRYKGKQRIYKGRLLKQVERNGYLSVSLSKGNIIKQKSIHRLVAEAFLPNPSNLPLVNHIDENKKNNMVSNLEWCSCAYNTNYGCGRKKQAESQQKIVLQYDKDGNLLNQYPSATIAALKNGYNLKTISQCCRGRTKSAYNYIWRYRYDIQPK